MSYEEFKNKLKLMRMSITDFANMMEMRHSSISGKWSKKVPVYAIYIIELLEKLSEQDRVLFIHEKLKEVQNSK
jgi:hypothetical protein